MSCDVQKKKKQIFSLKEHIAGCLKTMIKHAASASI
jgi:hypothetical protein